jgi:glutathionylspermidine synthase
VLTAAQHRELVSATNLFARVFEKAVTEVSRNVQTLERFGFPWIAAELLAREPTRPIVVGRFDFLLDPARGWQLLEYNADTPSGPRETVEVERAITRHLGEAATHLRRSGPHHAASVRRAVVEALPPGARTLGVFTDAGYAEDLAQTVFLARLLAPALTRHGVSVVFGDLDNLQVSRGRLRLLGTPLDAVYRYFPFEWMLGQQVFVDLFDAVSAGKVRLLNGLRGLLAQNKGLLAWLWAHREDDSIFSASERSAIQQHLPPVHWIADVKPNADRTNLVLKQVFGREGEEVYFGDSISQADWERCVAWRSYIVQERVRPVPTTAVVQTASGPEVQQLWPVVGSFTAGGRWAGYYTRAGEPITTGHAKFFATYWLRPSGTMPARRRQT